MNVEGEQPGECRTKEQMNIRCRSEQPIMIIEVNRIVQIKY
jgi:hypothetical protein